MAHSSYASLASWCKYFLVAGTGTPLASKHPINSEMPATSSFAFDEVPEPRLVKHFLAFIGARENIHPLRLWFSSLRGNEKQKMAPVDGELRGLPSTAQVPTAPNATNAVILTVHMTAPFRREDATASPSILFLCMRTILDTTRRAEHGCRAAVGPAVYDGCVGFSGYVLPGVYWCHANCCRKSRTCVPPGSRWSNVLALQLTVPG